MHVVLTKSSVAGVVCSDVDKDTGVSVLKLIFNMYYKYFLADGEVAAADSPLDPTSPI